MIEAKTKAYIVRGRSQCARRIPCFINGDLPRPKGVGKLQVWYFTDKGDLIATVLPAGSIQLPEFKLI